MRILKGDLHKRSQPVQHMESTSMTQFNILKKDLEKLI